MSWLGLDIGGANLKAADGLGFAASRPFALWKQPERLAAELTELLAASPPAERIAITMTGELCDCFPDKATGVRQIVDSAVTAVGSRPILIYLTDGRFVPSDDAVSQPKLAAASNWHCLARFAGRYAPHGAALLIDIGSTTTDIIPLIDGVCVARGATDTERILESELIYRGVERTPCIAVASQLALRNTLGIPMAAEFFATMRDVYLLLGDLPELPDDCDTADGRPATKAWAARRIARLIAADETECDADTATEIAIQLADEMRQTLSKGLSWVTYNLILRGGFPNSVICSGHGEFLARMVLNERAEPVTIYSLNELLSPEVARCAPAHALAVLAREMLP